MTKVELTKAIVNNMIGYSIGAAASVFFRNNRRHSDNKTIELVIDVATLVTVLAVGGTIHQPVRAYTDKQIEAIFAWWDEKVTNRHN